jgi:hypothetical protein
MIRRGQRYRTRVAIPVTCITQFNAPFSGGYGRELPAGEEFTVSHDPPSGATAVGVDPTNYRRLQSQFVPWGDRIRFLLYVGYYLIVSMERVSADCDLVFDPSS